MVETEEVLAPKSSTARLNPARDSSLDRTADDAAGRGRAG